MEQRIKRINELARKAKTSEGLTKDEIIEQQKLRQEYLKNFRKNLRSQLDGIKIVRS